MKKSIFPIIILFAISGIFVSHYRVEQNAVASKADKISFYSSVSNILEKNGNEYYSRAGYTIFKKNNSSSEKLSLNNFYVKYDDKKELQLNKENYKYVLSFFFPYFNLLYAN